MVKPGATEEAGLSTEAQLGNEEGKWVWQQVQQHEQLAEACIQAVRDEHLARTRFSLERDRVCNAFGELCVRSLEHCFIRPLLLSLGLLEEYCQEPCDLDDEHPEPLTKFNALFVASPVSQKLRKSIVEHCGVSNFDVLQMKSAGYRW